MLRVVAATTLVLGAASPSVNLMCQDPRVVAGGAIMGGYVTPNQDSEDISFTASSSTYTYGEAVEFYVGTNGSRFVSDDAPSGVFLAVQVSFAPSLDPTSADRTAANGEAMGAFHNVSTDLASLANCASTLYSFDGANSTSAFGGASLFRWTPSHHPWEAGILKTTGDATFSLVWANDPTGAGVKNPYVYLKTLTIADGNAENHQAAPGDDASDAKTTDAAAGATANAGGCVLNATSVAGVRHAYKASPVFVQRLASGEGQTFAAGRCIACRADAPCASARVTCGTEPGVPVVEELWTASAACVGEPNAKRFVDDVACPGPEHWHADTLDLDRFVPKLRKDFPAYFADDETAHEALAE